MNMEPGVFVQCLHGFDCVKTTENSSSHTLLAGFNRNKYTTNFGRSYGVQPGGLA